ncbi:hypothetical protein [Dietzia sp. 179-F 9C3 NHS]|uniref:hypothetical protein n=1 Tax=Dietzia sp. 179-F 9C3 NHS TaxID=3374295 RepID=UPI00387A1D2D
MSVALWRTTEESVQRMLHDWGRPVAAVRIIPPGRSESSTAAYLDGDTAVIDAEPAGLSRAVQGARVDSLTYQLQDPAAAARVAAVCAPLVVSTWRTAPPPRDRRLAETMMRLDQIRAEAQLNRRQPALRYLLPAAATWVARAPVAGSDDAVAFHLLTDICPRTDALILPAAATARIKAPLVDYLGVSAMRDFLSAWRHLLASPDQRSSLMAVARRWIELTDTHLPGYRDRAGAPTLLALAARHATTDLEMIETDALDRVAELRQELGDETERRSVVLDPDHGAAGAGTGLPAHRSLRHLAPTDDDLALRTDLRSALAVAKARQIATVARPSRTPIGRADPRELVRMAAQQHRGTPVTATPWTRHIPEVEDEPDIVVAAVLDTSASMAPWMRRACPLMWAVACGAHDLGGVAAVWGFGGEAFELIRAGSAPHLVPHVRDSGSGSTGYADAVAAACEEADLIRRRGARLLVVLTDGRLPDPQEARRLQATLTDVVASGATVLWCLTRSVNDALVPDQAIVAQGVTPGLFADTVRGVLLNTVRASQ